MSWSILVWLVDMDFVLLTIYSYMKAFWQLALVVFSMFPLSLTFTKLQFLFLKKLIIPG